MPACLPSPAYIPTHHSDMNTRDVVLVLFLTLVVLICSFASFCIILLKPVYVSPCNLVWLNVSMWSSPRFSAGIANDHAPVNVNASDCKCFYTWRCAVCFSHVPRTSFLDTTKGRKFLCCRIHTCICSYSGRK